MTQPLTPIEQAKKALEPFAKIADKMRCYDDEYKPAHAVPNVGELRAAKDAYEALSILPAQPEPVSGDVVEHRALIKAMLFEAIQPHLRATASFVEVKKAISRCFHSAALLRAPEAAPGWQKIETFDAEYERPKIGEEILGFIPWSEGDGGYVASIYWDPGYEGGPDCPGYSATWVTCRSGNHVKPTWVRLLPSAPSAPSVDSGVSEAASALPTDRAPAQAFGRDDAHYLKSASVAARNSGDSYSANRFFEIATRIEALSRASLLQSGWKTIDSAPKTEWVLGFFPTRTGVQYAVMIWLHGSDRWSCASPMTPELPTHWMPLPAAPTPPQAGSEDDRP